MKIYRVAIVEDNPDDRQWMLSMTGRVGFLTVVGVFADPVAALSFLSAEPVDLLLLDLDLPGLSGFDLLRSLARPPMVIMTTASLAAPLEAYDLGAVDYLVKPIRYERFLRAVVRRLAQPPILPPTAPTALVLKQGFLSVRVMVADIDYVEAVKTGSELHLSDGTVVPATQPLAEVQARLPADSFARIHKSHIVAINRVSSFNSREVVMPDGRRLQIGRAYAADFSRLLRGGT